MKIVGVRNVCRRYPPHIHLQPTIEREGASNPLGSKLPLAAARRGRPRRAVPSLAQRREVVFARPLAVDIRGAAVQAAAEGVGVPQLDLDDL